MPTHLIYGKRILPGARNVPIVRIAQESRHGATTRTREPFVTRKPVESPMPRAQRGRLGAAAVNAKRTPEQRRELARHAHQGSVANAVIGRLESLNDEQRQHIRAVVDSAPPLTEDQKACLRAIFAPALQGAETP